MTKITRHVAGVLTVAMLFGTPGALFAAELKPPAKPNIVFILADDK